MAYVTVNASPCQPMPALEMVLSTETVGSCRKPEQQIATVSSQHKVEDAMMHNVGTGEKKKISQCFRTSWPVSSFLFACWNMLEPNHGRPWPFSASDVCKAAHLHGLKGSFKPMPMTVIKVGVIEACGLKASQLNIYRIRLPVVKSTRVYSKSVNICFVFGAIEL